MREFAAAVADRFLTVDVLIHNAAVFDVTQKERELTEEGVESVWSVNHLGPVLLTELLLGHLVRAGGRVITISSQGLVAMPRLRVDLDDPEFADRPFSVTKAYYQSKRAQVMYTWWLASRLAGTGVTANAIRVTAVKIDLSRHPDLPPLKRSVYSMKSRMSLTPSEMAKTYAWLATSDDVSGVSGRYFDEKQKEVRSAAYERDPAAIDALMKLTASHVAELKEVLSGGRQTADRR